MQVDAVITWVNGNDKNWQEKLNIYTETKIDFNKKKESVRYNSIGEINIAIKSIIKYASFVKNIFLVTDNQVPDFFDELKLLALKNKINLEIIDHRVIFKGYEKFLPCFNSCTIGCMLYRIPNLSNHFIIFNDDTFIMRETKISDFFKNDIPIIRGKWKKYHENQSIRKTYYKILSTLGLNKKQKTLGFKKFQQNSAKLAGTKNYLRRFHTPVAVRKSTLQFYFDNNHKILETNIKHKFRNKDQFIVSSLSEHLEIKNNSFYHKKDAQLIHFRSYKRHHIVKLKLFLFTINKNKLFTTFQSLELANMSSQNYILNWIENRLK
ncbi:Stealth CR1 domain-containing protein [Flavobacterium sp. GSA192]|uniref:Stealth CR1 domain-containing protein n=1 Tax=Flavobacterium sp. GSA192 TaxID=2576304 RepID=UPI00112B0F59|nr:Stealth CR1 domain-containing protein [Flavobacterium sp. GSA192]